MRSSALDNSLVPFDSVTCIDSSPAPSFDAENSPQSDEFEKHDTMLEQNYDPGEGPSSGNMQDKCSICDFTTSNREEIVQHLIEHIVSKNINSTSEIINMALTQLRYLHNQENHDSSGQDSVQGNSNSVESNIDPEKDDYEDPGVRVPQLNSQGKLKTFPCKHCDVKAVTKIEYWAHKRIHIHPDKLLSCYKCPFVTEYKHHLEYHLLKHTGYKPYKCSKCPYSCVNNSMLNSHMKSHSNVYQYRCRDCKYATKYCHTLKQHLRKYQHEPAKVLNVDGTESPIVIDVYGTKRGPKMRPKNNNTITTNNNLDINDDERTSLDSNCATTDTQTLVENAKEGNHRQQSASKAPQEVPSTSAQTLVSTSSTAFNLGMFANILSTKRNGNLAIQKDTQADQEAVHYPFQYHHPLFSSLNMATQQLTSNGLMFGETTRSTSTSTASEVDWQNTEGAADIAANLIETNLSADELEFLEGSTAENPVTASQGEQLEQLNKSGNMPLDLTAGSARNEASTSYQPPCQQAPLNLANSPRVAGTRRRKGIAVKLEYRVVEKEDTDEELIQSEKRLCQSASSTAASAPSTSPMAASAPSTSPMAASTPSTSFMVASAPSTVAIPEDNASDPTEPNKRCDKALTHNRLPTDQDRYLCEHCDIPYPDQKILHAHMRYHSRAEPFTCKICSKPYGNRETFNLHIYEKRCVNQRMR